MTRAVEFGKTEIVKFILEKYATLDWLEEHQLEYENFIFP